MEITLFCYPQHIMTCGKIILRVIALLTEIAKSDISVALEFLSVYAQKPQLVLNIN